VRIGRQTFARPMPYEVTWERDGKLTSVKTFSYSTASVVFNHERKEGREPELQVGGLLLAGPTLEEAAKAVVAGGWSE